MTKTFDQLLQERERLQAKYPPHVYARLQIKPAEVLRYIHDVTLFAESQSEIDVSALIWEKRR